MAVSICLVLSCLISSISIYYAPESDIRVKGYDHLNFSRTFVVQFRPSQYIIGLNRTTESKVMAIWIFLALWCLISNVSLYYSPESDIRVKRYVHLNFSRASVVQFQASQYIIGLDRTSESKVVALWICLALWCLISSMSIYYVPESDIRVECYEQFNFSRAFVVQFQASRYIVGLNRTSKSNVVVVWICLALWCLISSMWIYYALGSDIWVKSYDHMSF